jgi:RimJ/RimL family protein N-acetyltransferase
VVPPSLRTARLCIRALTPADAPFIVALLNDPAFVRNIGDRGVRTEADAQAYLAGGPLASYARHDFGLCAVELGDGAVPIGICGLLQRDELPAPDIGFAYLPEYRSRGYAFEAAVAVKGYAHNVLGIDTLLAIVNPDNEASIRLLAKLGFVYERVFRLAADAKALSLYAARAPRLW